MIPVARPAGRVTGGLGLAAAAGAFGSLDAALNIAFPDLVADFDLTVSELQWVVVSFVASYACLLILAGAIGDRVGHAPVALGGAGVSIGAMVACAAAPTFGSFLVARVVQGAGTAALMASAPALASTAVALDRRHRALGLFQSAAAIGAAVAPVIGGVLVALMGWRGVFWFRVPLAAMVAVLAWQAWVAGRAVARTGEGAATSPSAATRAVTGWRRLGQRRAVGANGLNVVVFAAAFSTWLLFPALLVDELGLALPVGGVVLALSPLSTAVGARFAPRAVDRLGSGMATSVGLGLVTVGLGGGAATGTLLARGSGGAAVIAAVLTLLVAGLGLGLFSVPNMATVMATIGPGGEGVAGAANLMARTVGITAGAAWHAWLFDRLEPSRGFGPAFAVVFAVAAALVGLHGILGVALCRGFGTRRARKAPTVTSNW